MRLLLAIALTISLTPTLWSQTWVRVASEGDTVTATATVRYGAAQGAPATAGNASCATVGGCWKQLSVSGPFVVGNAFFGDPIPGTVKELDVLETSAAQLIQVNGKPVTVPALAVSGGVPAVNTVTFSETLNFNGTTITATCVAPVVKQ